jgi:nicotinic acid phosphoribosyltransferase
MSFSEKELAVISTHTGNHPLYLKILSKFIQLSGKKDEKSIEEFMNYILRNDLDLYFSERLKQLSTKEIPILYCMAQHNVQNPAKISRIVSQTQTTVRRFLSIMVEKGFVTLEDRGTFVINDPVFKNWLNLRRKFEA